MHLSTLGYMSKISMAMFEARQKGLKVEATAGALLGFFLKVLINSSTPRRSFLNIPPKTEDSF